LKRPEQHETDSAADALFRNVFHHWAVTPSERDYGWDHVVEVFRNRESTGILFNGQLRALAVPAIQRMGRSYRKNWKSVRLIIWRDNSGCQHFFFMRTSRKGNCFGVRSSWTSRCARS
jgi:hypothetical protein